MLLPICYFAIIHACNVKRKTAKKVLPITSDLWYSMTVLFTSENCITARASNTVHSWYWSFNSIKFHVSIIHSSYFQPQHLMSQNWDDPKSMKPFQKKLYAGQIKQAQRIVNVYCKHSVRNSLTTKKHERWHCPINISNFGETNRNSENKQDICCSWFPSQNSGS